MLGLLLLMQGCASLPSLAGRPASTHLEPARDSRLGQVILPLTEAHPNQSGVIPLKRGLDAFAARVLLADAAERSLDVQYYIWRGDLSGTLLIEALRRAAARGVRVRLLLDDANTVGARRDAGRARRAAEHRGAPVQSVPGRGSRRSATCSTSRALNRRMHNKSFTADNLATWSAGATSATSTSMPAATCCSSTSMSSRSGPWSRRFAKLRPVLGERIGVSGAAHRRADRRSGQRTPRQRRRGRARRRSRAYRAALADSHLVAATCSRTDCHSTGRPCAWSATTLPRGWGWRRPISCSGLDSRRRRRRRRGRSAPVALLRPRRAGDRRARRDGPAGRRGPVLTNSLESTDVAPVHAGYAKRRKALLEAGVVLYEVKRESVGPARPRSPAAARGYRDRACTPRRSRSTTSWSSSARSTSIRARRS